MAINAPSIKGVSDTIEGYILPDNIGLWLQRYDIKSEKSSKKPKKGCNYRKI